VSDQLERLGIVVRADGVVETSNGIKLVGKEVNQLADNLGDLGQKLLATVAAAKANAAATQGVGTAAVEAATSVVGQTSAAAAATVAQTKHAAAVREGSSALSHFSLNNAQATREMIVLAHELSQGNFSRFGGSMMVMARASGLASAIFTSTGLAIGAVIGVVAAFAVAAYKGAQESKALGDALIVTNGYAGVTAGGFEQMASRVATASNTHIGTARTALLDLTKTGRLSGDALELLSTVVVREADLTGQKLSKVAQDYAKMPDGIAKWAEEHNRSMHFMSVAQYLHIQLLEEQGKKQEAMIAVGQALNANFSTQDTNLGVLQRAWKFLGDEASSAWDKMKGLGRKATVDDALAQATAEVENARLAMSGNFGGTMAERTARLQKALESQSVAQSAVLESKRQAAHTAEMDRIQEEGIAGAKVTDQALMQYDKKYAMAKKLQEQQVAFAAQAAAGNPVSAAQQKVILDGIRDSYKDKKLPVAGDNYLDTLQKQLRGVEQEARVYDDVLAHLNTNGAKFTAQQREMALSLAKQIDGWKDKRKADEAEIKYMGQMATLHDNEMNRQKAQRATDAQQLQDQQFEISLYGKTAQEVDRLTAAYKAQVEWKQRVTALMDARQNGAMSAQEFDQGMVEADAHKNAQLVIANAQLAEKYKPGWQKLLDGWKDTTQLQVDAYNGAMNAIVQGGEEMWVQLATTGKVNAKNMVDGVLAEMARLYYRKNIAGPLASFGESILNNLIPGGGGGSNSVNSFDSGSMMTLIGASHGGGIAGGTPTFTKPVDMAVFAGAPRFHGGGLVGGEVPIIAKQGEGVFTPEQMANLQPAGASKVITFAPQINIDARTDRAEVYELVSRAVVAGQADLLDKIDRGMV
jgi:phage-related minor tail protein